MLPMLRYFSTCWFHFIKRNPSVFALFVALACKRDLFCIFYLDRSTVTIRTSECIAIVNLNYNVIRPYEIILKVTTRLFTPVFAFDSILFYIQQGRILYLKRTRINIFQLRLFFFSIPFFLYLTLVFLLHFLLFFPFSNDISILVYVLYRAPIYQLTRIIWL